MNTIKISKWMTAAAATTVLFGAAGALARDILLVEAGKAPDPHQVAAVFGRAPAEPMKLRGIRVLNTAGSVAAAQMPAARVDCPPTRPAPYKVRGVRRASESTAPNLEAAAAECTEAVASAPAVAATNAANPANTTTSTNAMPTPGRSPESIALMVPFRFNSAQIADEAVAQLDAMAEGIKLAGPEVRIVIEGHTDAAGTDQYNLILSYLRASAVRDYLVREHGMSARNLRPVGMGKRSPINAANPNAPENRRVEFRVEQS